MTPRCTALLLALPLGTAGFACATSESPIAFCTSVAPVAITVDVSDSLSGQPLADSASGVVQAGAYVDSLHHAAPSTTLLFGGVRLGTYDVTVDRPGYNHWVRSTVPVTQTGICGNVLPVHLVALLQPAP